MKQQSLSNLSPIINNVRRFTQHSDIILAMSLVSVIMILLFPVHKMILDLLLALSISISILIMMNALFIEKPLDFSVFPSLLLVTAIIRLALNVASTRLILSEGHNGSSAAGHVIEAFGNFVMRGNIVIGLTVFGILTIINFVVITKGSGRIAEVAARFSLDAMPGKQMAIDADLSAGIIDEKEAKSRRKSLEDESTFFGSMDGANKFVRGDAIAGLLITVINLVGGIIIGIVQQDMDFSSALSTYSKLTIGDGLVSQVPALIVSLSAGLIVSKSGVVGSVDKAIFGQIAKHPQTFWMTSFVMLAMAFMPGLPAFVFLILAFCSGATAFLIDKLNKLSIEEAKTKESEEKIKEKESKEENISEDMTIDSIKLELGYNLLTLVNYAKGNKITDQIKSIRKQMARQIGFIVPSVRVHDNIQLENNQYLIKIKGIECARGEVKVDKLLLMNPNSIDLEIPGQDVIEPSFGLNARWIDEKYKDEANYKNLTVVDPATVITTHLAEVIKENITDLLTYAETQKLLNDLPEDYKSLLNDLIPSKISYGLMQRLLQNLLAESISIRDMPLILEAVSEATTSTKNINLITEIVRTRLARQISNDVTTEDGFIPVFYLSPNWEQNFNDNLVDLGGEMKQLSLEPSKVQDFVQKVKDAIKSANEKGVSPVIVTSSTIRPYVRSIVERFSYNTKILSQSEIHHKAKIKLLGQI